VNLYVYCVGSGMIQEVPYTRLRWRTWLLSRHVPPPPLTNSPLPSTITLFQQVPRTFRSSCIFHDFLPSFSSSSAFSLPQSKWSLEMQVATLHNKQFFVSSAQASRCRPVAQFKLLQDSSQKGMRFSEFMNLYQKKRYYFSFPV
jgi:hypothetical protein